MIVCHAIGEIREHLRAVRREGRTVGFVPTMGALHDGHVSLVDLARRENDVVVVSIFVNPAQFGPGEDLSAYPRTLDSDLERCRAAGVDLVFAPTTEQMYPAPLATRVLVGGLTEPMEGECRPGHFDGVALVVTKLFNIVGECSAYFGEKDAQQLRVVRRMAADLDQPVRIVASPTVREPDGLAMSSRNAYLSPPQRGRALVLSRALRAVQDLVAAGEHDVAALIERGQAILHDGADSVDYLAIVDSDTLEPLVKVDGPALVAGAVRIGRTRLIDNVTIELR